MGRLDRKVAVITGAASGIGRATAVRFAGEGASVVIADLNREGGESAVRECKENGGNAVFQLADVSREEDIKSAIDRAVKEFGRLDITFNNAGLAGAVGPIETMKAENWDRSFAILLRAVVLGIKYSIPAMRKAGGGSIISTASIAGLRGAAGLHAYCAAKAGVISLSRSASIELAADKIRVNCICPGLIATPLTYNRIPGGEQTASQVFAGFQPWKRTGRPEDIAAMALFLASDDSEFVSGQAMVVDGAATAGMGAMDFSPTSQAMVAPPEEEWSGPSFQMKKPA
ncbi:MAG TPA: SDR family NAD(P)-dependent oxidoreductase [Candidatus Binataceae bacterium]|nr:SDR family NAD(P)-dependent oxidoreductase [Candidatus Binataceae bacterium]